MDFIVNDELTLLPSVIQEAYLGKQIDYQTYNELMALLKQVALDISLLDVPTSYETEGDWTLFIQNCKLNLTSLYTRLDILSALIDKQQVAIRTRVAQLASAVKRLRIYVDALPYIDSFPINKQHMAYTSDLATSMAMWDVNFNAGLEGEYENVMPIELSNMGMELPIASEVVLTSAAACDVEIEASLGISNIKIANLGIESVIDNSVSTSPAIITAYSREPLKPIGKWATITSVNALTPTEITLDGGGFQVGDAITLYVGVNGIDRTVTAVDDDGITLTIDSGVSQIYNGAKVVSSLAPSLGWIQKTRGGYTGGIAVLMRFSFEQQTEITHIRFTAAKPVRVAAVYYSDDSLDYNSAKIAYSSKVPIDIYGSDEIDVHLAQGDSPVTARHIWLVLTDPSAELSMLDQTDIDVTELYAATQMLDASLAFMKSKYQDELGFYEPIDFETASLDVLIDTFTTQLSMLDKLGLDKSEFENLTASIQQASTSQKQLAYKYQIVINEIEIINRRYANKGILVSRQLFPDTRARRITTYAESTLTSGATLEYYMQLAPGQSWRSITPGQTINIMRKGEDISYIDDPVYYVQAQPETTTYTNSSLTDTITLPHVPYIDIDAINDIEECVDTSGIKIYKYNPNLINWVDGEDEQAYWADGEDSFDGYRPISVRIVTPDLIVEPDEVGYRFDKIGAPVSVGSAEAPELIVKADVTEEVKFSLANTFISNITKVDGSNKDYIKTVTQRINDKTAIFYLGTTNVIAGTVVLYTSEIGGTTVDTSKYYVDYKAGVIFVIDKTLAEGDIWVTYKYTPFGQLNPWSMLADRTFEHEGRIPPTSGNTVPVTQNITNYTRDEVINFKAFNTNIFDMEQYCPVIQYVQIGRELRFNVDLGALLANGGSIIVSYKYLNLEPRLIVYMEREGRGTPRVTSLYVGVDTL